MAIWTSLVSNAIVPPSSGTGRVALVVVTVLLVVALNLPVGTTAPSGAAVSAPHRVHVLHPWPSAGALGRPTMHPLVSHPTAATHNALASSPCDTGGLWNVEVEQAYDPANGNIYEAWIGCGGIGFSRSLDGGYSFQPALTVPGSSTGPSGPSNSSWDPAIAVAPNGTVYVAYMVNRTLGDAPVVAWSWNQGVSFAGFQYAFRPAFGNFADRDFLAVAPNGTLYLSWDYSPNASIDQLGCATAGSCYFTAGDYNILVVHSSDGGANWSNPVPVDPEYPNGGAPCGPLLVEPSGAIDVLFEDYTVGPAHTLGLGRNYFTRSTNGGGTWSPPVAVGTATFPNTVWWIDGSIARDNSGTLYASFDTISGKNDTAQVTLSTNGGVSWAIPTRVNPDSDNGSHIQVEVAGGENGTAYVAWMGNNSSFGWSTFESTFSGNGTTLSAPTLVSDQYGLDGYWVGDTIGVTYLGFGRVAVSWSYAPSNASLPAVEIYEAVLGASAPGPPTILAVTPGDASAVVYWSSPGAGAYVNGYMLVWGVEGMRAFSENLSGITHSSTLTGLQAFARYTIEVAAVNTAGFGPFSRPVNLTLTAWAELHGMISPSTASVRLDGLSVALSGGAFSANTTPGGHVLSAGGGPLVPQTVLLTLPWNGTAWQNLTLGLLPGTVAGTISPSNALATWDGAAISLGAGGRYHETGPANSAHTLRVSAAAHASRVQNVTVQANATVWLNVSLPLLNVTLSLFVTPAGAQVSVGGVGVSLDAMGRANVSRQPGLYEVEAKLPGYLPYFRNVSLASGPNLLSINLVSTHGNAPGPNDNGSPVLPAWAWVGAAIAVALLLAVAIRRVRSRKPPPPVDTGPADRLYGTHGEHPEYQDVDGAPVPDDKPVMG